MPSRCLKLLMGGGVGDDGAAGNDGVVLIGDAGLEQTDFGGLLLDDAALDVQDVVEAVGVGFDGVGGHVQGLGVGPRKEPPEAWHLVRSDDGEHGGIMGGGVRHGKRASLAACTP